MFMKKAFAGLALVVVASATSAAVSAPANLVANGNFESGSLSGWALTGGLDKAYWNTVDKTVDLHLPVDPNSNGNYIYSAGEFGAYSSITQTIALVEGTTYTVSFDYLNTTPIKVKTPLKQGFQLSIGEAGTTEVLDMSYSISKTKEYMPTWHTYTDTFYADSSSLVLTLKSRNDASWNYFDNIRVSAPVAAVPEPETYAMLLAGLGLMGAIARRRKAKQI